MSSQPARVTEIRITKLFRQYDHTIRLRQPERVTILHGKNGVGKTVTLSLVAAVMQGNYERLIRFPFELLRIEFDGGAYIQVTQEYKKRTLAEVAGAKRNPDKAEAEIGEDLYIKFEYPINGKPAEHLVKREMLNQVQRFASTVNWLESVAEDLWLDRRTHDLVSSEDIKTRYSEGFLAATKKEPTALTELRNQISVHFIEAQRLFKINTQAPSGVYYRSSMSIISTVNEVAKEMATKIKDADSLYRSTSTRLDDSLPSRLFTAAPAAESLGADQLQKRTEELEKERQRLRDIGLVEDPAKPFDPKALNETQRAMFSVYLKDNEEKLSVFGDLADRAELLLNIVNRKFKPKRIRLDKDSGYRIFSHDGGALELERLSSGEQHELVLLHNLLFRVSPSSLLLIDEPELSLHVTWQTEFLRDLIEIAKKAEFDAIVATHSPYIVGRRRDLMVQLGESK